MVIIIIITIMCVQARRAFGKFTFSAHGCVMTRSESVCCVPHLVAQAIIIIFRWAGAAPRVFWLSGDCVRRGDFTHNRELRLRIARALINHRCHTLLVCESVAHGTSAHTDPDGTRGERGCFVECAR